MKIKKFKLKIIDGYLKWRVPTKNRLELKGELSEAAIVILAEKMNEIINYINKNDNKA